MVETESLSSSLPGNKEVQQEQEGESEKKPRPRRIIKRRNRNNDKERNTSIDSIVDPMLLEEVMKESGLPIAYNFEIVKTVKRIKSANAKHIALQMPEGLLMYATTLGDIFKRLTNNAKNMDSSSCLLEEVSILGDVTYGACCVDDIGAKTLGAELLIHYGHSCLVPLQHTVIPCLYIFVEIIIDVKHMLQCLTKTLVLLTDNNMSNAGANHEGTSIIKYNIYLLGTVQFRHALVEAKKILLGENDGENKIENNLNFVYSNVSIPQVKPLSPGEVLGCTSPILPPNNDNRHEKSIVLFISDGRFHLESTLISNPHIHIFYRYDPYSKTLTEETYNHKHMYQLRKNAINKARSTSTNVTTSMIMNVEQQQQQIFGIILGTLGRQGNPAILLRLQKLLKKHSKRSFIILLSEITSNKLQLFENNDNNINIHAWVQVACPRLSIDWGHYLGKKPVLTPYELYITLQKPTDLTIDHKVTSRSEANNQVEETSATTSTCCKNKSEKERMWWEENDNGDNLSEDNCKPYPMDFYSNNGGPWSNYYQENRNRKI